MTNVRFTSMYTKNKSFKRNLHQRLKTFGRKIYDPICTIVSMFAGITE